MRLAERIRSVAGMQPFCDTISMAEVRNHMSPPAMLQASCYTLFFP